MLILKRTGLAVLGLLLVLTVFVGILLLDKPSTSPIVNQSGEPLENSIAQIEFVDIGGIPQWLLIRSHNIDNPPLLVVHGGPGSPEAELFRAFNGELEEHFTVVHWHQRGAGWTRTGDETANDYKIDTHLEDVDEIVRHVYERFGEQKVYILGHSWGSVLGIHHIRNHPELVAAYIGVGQVTNMTESEQQGCDYIQEQAQIDGDAQVLAEIDSFCHPPFTPEYAMTQRPYLSQYKGDMQELTLPQLGWQMFRTEEATLMSVINLAMGSLESLENMWDELMGANFFEEPTTFDVPIFFGLGRTDYQVSATLAADYFDKISAPCKKIQWFENSGHSPMWEEPEDFNKFMITEVLNLKGCQSN
jgi:proline iminopeptidase